MPWKPTGVQRDALRTIVRCGGRVTISRRGTDRLACVSRGAGAPQRVPLPSVDAFVRHGVLELVGAQSGATVFETYQLSESGKTLADEVGRG